MILKNFKLVNVLIVLLLVVSVSISAAPQSMNVGGKTLVLNGTGPRNKAFLTVYYCSLYLLQKSSDWKKIIDADEPMAVKLVIDSKLLSREKFIDAVEAGFKTTDTKPSAADKKKFFDMMNFEIAKGNVIDLVYDGKGLSMLKDGQSKGTVAGVNFKKALFGIWLGSNPVQSNLKAKMLGN